jgi:hypothetical protein
MHQEIFHHQEHVRRQAIEQERASRLRQAFTNINGEQRRARRRRGPLSWLLRTVGVMLVRVGTRLADDPLEGTRPLLGGGSFSQN